MFIIILITGVIIIIIIIILGNGLNVVDFVLSIGLIRATLEPPLIFPG